MALEVVLIKGESTNGTIQFACREWDDNLQLGLASLGDVCESSSTFEHHDIINAF
jgi:hypothetical protein